MQVFAETERLILRELLPTDAEGIFELDSDPDVHRYLGTKPIQTIEQAKGIIEFIRQQYIDNGIGRWAVEDKNTREFMGWTGLKFVTETINNRSNFHDFGYRFIKRYWGRGYATETARPCLQYGFEVLKLNEIYGMAEMEHLASRNVLQKSGLKFIETFDFEDKPHVDYKITREEFMLKYT